MDPPDGAERRPGFPALGMKRSKARLTKTVGLSGPRASAIRIALPVAAAGLLGKSRLDWQVSLSGTLHLWNRSASIAPCAKSSTIVSSRLSSLYSSAAMPFTPLRTGLSVTRPSLSRRFRITFRCYAISSPGYHIRTTSTCPVNNPPPADHWLITPLLGKGPAADDGCVPPQPNSQQTKAQPKQQLGWALVCLRPTHDQSASRSLSPHCKQAESTRGIHQQDHRPARCEARWRDSERTDAPFAVGELSGWPGQPVPK